MSVARDVGPPGGKSWDPKREDARFRAPSPAPLAPGQPGLWRNTRKVDTALSQLETCAQAHSVETMVILRPPGKAVPTAVHGREWGCSPSAQHPLPSVFAPGLDRDGLSHLTPPPTGQFLWDPALCPAASSPWATPVAHSPAETSSASGLCLMSPLLGICYLLLHNMLSVCKRHPRVSSQPCGSGILRVFTASLPGSQQAALKLSARTTVLSEAGGPLPGSSFWQNSVP